MKLILINLEIKILMIKIAGYKMMRIIYLILGYQLISYIILQYHHLSQRLLVYLIMSFNDFNVYLNLLIKFKLDNQTSRLLNLTNLIMIKVH